MERAPITAANILNAARVAGVHVQIEGNDLILQASTEPPAEIALGVTLSVGPPPAITVNVLLTARRVYWPVDAFAKSRSSYVPPGVDAGMRNGHEPDAAAPPLVREQLT